MHRRESFDPKPHSGWAHAHPDVCAGRKPVPVPAGCSTCLWGNPVKHSQTTL